MSAKEPTLGGQATGDEVADEVLGASMTLISGEWDWPIHGLRHSPSPGTSGWYLWTGDYSDADGFFKPWHVSHLVEQVPEVQHLLQLEPGSRFLIAPGHEDVWHDPRLLDAT